MWRRLKNFWFLSGLSKEDIRKNPETFMQQYVNAQEMSGKAYIIGLSEEEQSYQDSLNVDNKDTKIS